MTVLYIASNSKQDEKLEHLFEIYFRKNFGDKEMIIRDHAYYFILKANLAVVNYSMICGFKKVKNVVQRKEYFKDREIKQTVMEIMETIYCLK